MTHRIYVDGELVPEALIGQESERVARDPRWATVAEGAERARQQRAAAEQSAIGRVLVEQAAARDPRPVDPAVFGAGSATHEGRGQLPQRFRR
jgi:hypothetical protein